MPTIKIAADVQVVGGPQLSVAHALEVKAYSKYEFLLNKDNPTQTLTLGKDLGFLWIKSNLDETSKTKVQYKAGDKTIALDAPQLYLGKEGVYLLGGKGSDLSLAFTLLDPQDTDAVMITVLTGPGV